MAIFDKDITIDEQAFVDASLAFDTLGADLQKIRNKIENLLEQLQIGFDSTAGKIFHNSCQTSLIKPLDEQKIVIDAISQALKNSKDKYQSVFDAYRELNRSIASYSE